MAATAERSESRPIGNWRRKVRGLAWGMTALGAATMGIGTKVNLAESSKYYEKVNSRVVNDAANATKDGAIIFFLGVNTLMVVSKNPDRQPIKSQNLAA